MAGMFRRFFIACALLLPTTLLTITTPALTVSAQVDPAWTILDVTTLPLPTRIPQFAFSYLLSPDDAQLAWVEAEQKQICLMDIASQVKRCRPSPPHYLNLALLAWSPDGQYIALRDGFGEYSEHVAYETETDTYHEIDSDLDFWFGIHWDPSIATNATSAANPAIYVITHEYEGTSYAVLRKHWVLTGEQEIIDPRSAFNAPIMVYVALSVSLDGTRFVFSLEEDWAEAGFEPGLWVMDTTTMNVDSVVTFNDLGVNLSEREVNNARVTGMVWDHDQNRLLVLFELMSIPGETYSVTSFDLNSGAIQPLVTVEDALALTGERRFHEGYLTPDGQFFFYLDATNQSGKSTVFALPLGTSEREPLIVTEDYTPGCPMPSLLVTIGRDDGGEARRYLYQPHGSCP